MKKVMVGFTCIYSAALLFSAYRSTAQTGLDMLDPAQKWQVIPASTQTPTQTPTQTGPAIPATSQTKPTMPATVPRPVSPTAPQIKKETPTVSRPVSPTAPRAKRVSPTAGSFSLANKTGVYTTATPRTISVHGVTLNPIFSKQKGLSASNQIINDLKNEAVSSDTQNPTAVSRGVVGLQLKIGNKIYLASLHGIPQNAALEVVDRGIGFAIQSPKDATVKIRPMMLKYSKGQTQILKTGIDIPDLPPEIFSIRKMKLPGLNPLSG